jgi:lysophospholipase L1-like esterase
VTWPAPTQQTVFFPTVYDQPGEAGVAVCEVPDPGGLYVLQASATINVASTAGHGVVARLRLDDVGGPLLSGDAIRSGSLPAGELVTLTHPGMESGVLAGPHKVVATVQRLVGSGRWQTLEAGNVLSVSTRPVARLLTVIGDSWSSGQPGIGGLGVKGWPTLVARRFGSDFQNWAVGGTGYVNNAGGHTFQVRSQITAPESQTVVVFGSVNDQTIAPASVATAATATYQTIRTRAPGARLVVIGPQWPNAQRPANLLTIRDTVRQAALNAGAEFVDPLAEGWFDTHPDLIGGDGWHPTDAGHAYLADRIASHL